jgi:hypothetical protein
MPVLADFSIRSNSRLFLPTIERMCFPAITGAEGWEDIEEFGQSKEGWLRQFLELANGIPSHDTFRRVFSLLDAVAFQERFIRWVEGVFTVTRGQVVSVDGKTARGSQDKGKGKCLASGQRVGECQRRAAWPTSSG